LNGRLCLEMEFGLYIYMSSKSMLGFISKLKTQWYNLLLYKSCNEITGVSL